MTVQTQLEQAVSETSKTLADPLASAANKVIAITASGATGVGSAVLGGYTMQEWTIVLGLLAALFGVIYGLMNMIAISPKTWGSVRWWFGKDRRRPDYLRDDDAARRRATDNGESA